MKLRFIYAESQVALSYNVFFKFSDVPQVKIDVVKVVGARKIFVNWTINDGNEPVKEYFILVRLLLILFDPLCSLQLLDQVFIL